MGDRLIKTLVAVSGYWLISMLMGFLLLPAWAFAAASLLLLGVLAYHISRLDSPRAAGREDGGSATLRSMLANGAGHRNDSPRPMRLPDPAGVADSGNWAVAYGICVLDRECRVLWSNGLAAAHFGIMDADAGKPIHCIAGERSLEAYLEAREFSAPLRFETTRCGGKALAVWLVPYLDAQWLLLSLDAAQAARVDRQRRDRIADALHELCTPVTLIAGDLDALRVVEAARGPLRAHLDSMEDQCRRIQAIIENLLNLATLESVPEPPADTPVGMDALLRVIRSEALALSGGRHRVLLDAEAGLDLVGARSEIASACRNLAVNAVRYTPAGCEVRISWQSTGTGAAFVVEDNGVGIAKDDIPRLTERFYRVNRDAAPRGGGAGLGLAIVNDVLTRHQAALEIESTLGKGSRFTARFPSHRIVRAPQARPARAARERAYPLIDEGISFTDAGEGLPSRA